MKKESIIPMPKETPPERAVGIVVMGASFQLPLTDDRWATIHVYRYNTKYRVDAHINNIESNGCYDYFDSSLNRVFETAEKALKEAAQSVVNQFEKHGVRAIGAWKQDYFDWGWVDEHGGYVWTQKDAAVNKPVDDNEEGLVLKIRLSTSMGEKIAPLVYPHMDKAQAALKRASKMGS